MYKCKRNTTIGGTIKTMKLIKYAINGISILFFLIVISVSLFSSFSVFNVLSPPSNPIPFIYGIFSSAILYYILQPLHELGHYYTATHYAKINNYKVEFCLHRNTTNCSDWTVFDIKEYIHILLSGSMLKIIFCILTGYIMHLFNEHFISQICIFTIAFEVIANCTTFNKKSDFNRICSALKLKEAPNDEDSDFSNKKTDFFIKRIYPFLLIPFCCIFFKVLSSLFNYLWS